MRTSFHKIILTALGLGFPALLFAAEQAAVAAPAEKSVWTSFNAVLIGLVCLVLILLLSILILGNTLRQLGFVYRDKMRRERSASGAVKAMLLLLAATGISKMAMAQDAAAAAPVEAPVSNFISGIPKFDFYFLMGAIALELLVIITLTLLIRTVVRLLNAQPETETATAVATKKVIKISFWDRFNKVVPIEKEQDIMLDHDYDGIRELDNSLPPWWKYGFYLTIITAVIYLWYYHMGGNGPSSYDEYVAEVQKGEEAKAAYLAKSANNVDENTVKMLDAAGITAGQNIFQTTCAACHAKDGGGGVGPNLTDDYWLHGGKINDVFKSIKYGWVDKGMKSWKDDFSPIQLAQLASYVKSLQGTKPAAPKEKQGELDKEGNDVPADQGAAAKDSTIASK